MPEVKTDQEPSIEEILESIRQIISEDGEPVQAQPAPVKQAAPPPPPKPAPAPKAPPANVLDLTDRVEPQVSVQIELQDTAHEETDSSALLSDDAADAAAAAMARLLAGNVAVERDVPGRVGNVTLEDIARELMKPMIRSWLDQNLPRIIEKMVAKEIEKVSRLALRQ